MVDNSACCTCSLCSTHNITIGILVFGLVSANLGFYFLYLIDNLRYGFAVRPLLRTINLLIDLREAPIRRIWSVYLFSNYPFWKDASWHFYLNRRLSEEQTEKQLTHCIIFIFLKFPFCHASFCFESNLKVKEFYLSYNFWEFGRVISI